MLVVYFAENSLDFVLDLSYYFHLDEEVPDGPHPGDNKDSFQDLFVINVIPQETFELHQSAGMPPVPGVCDLTYHGPLAKYVRLRVVHAPGMPGRFSRHKRSRHASRDVRETHAMMHAGSAN